MSYKKKNVYEATLDRLEFVFNEFDQIIVAFSGGKDSGLLLNLTIDFAKKINQLKKVGVFHLDYEAQYQMTTEYVERTFKNLPEEVKRYWFCLPFKAQCAVSMHQTYWQPWKKENKDIWVRKMPKECINEENFPFNFNYEIWDYDFNTEFAKAISKNKKTAILVGIRTQESLNRFRAIFKEKKNTYKNIQWTTGISKNAFTVYPLYDWKVEDIWTANAKLGYDYNKLYDLMYQAGVPLHAMRVASPFNDAAIGSLQLYKAIEPHTWGKLVSRVNGVNFSGIYGGTTAMGWKKITKPPHHTWKSYLQFLLSTLPEESRKNYEKKFNVSEEFWKNKGGVVSEQTIKELKETGIKFDIKESPYSDKKAITFETYPDELPVTEFQKVPSYKRMCVTILKNDHTCKYMGFSFTKEERERRKKIIEKYKNIL